MNWIAKNWAAVLLLFAGVCACIATFFLSKQDQTQKNLIQKLGEENVKLSQQTKSLSNLNNEISQKVEKISQENNKLATQNLELNEQTKELVFEVQLLTEKSKELISKIDNRTSYEAEENLVSGELKMLFNSKIKDHDMVTVSFGGIKISNTVEALKSGKSGLWGYATQNGDKDLLSLKFDNENRMLFSLKVFDIDGNLIAEIEDNQWRPNKNFSGKFNYDDSGFEVMDNKGNVAINIDIIGNNTIIIQGIYPIKEINKIYLWGNNKSTDFPMRNSTVEAKLFEKFHKDYDTILNETIENLKIKQLFEYTGKDWLHKRKH